jgi:two-component system response regulator NreC
MSPHVLLAHHYPLALEALRTLIEGQGFPVTSTANGPEAARLAAQLRPEIAILDLELSRGTEAVGEILAASPATKIVGLSQRTDEHSVWQALRAGAKAYILKNKKPEELLSAIDEVSRGRTYYSPEISRIALVPAMGARGRYAPHLTEREREVVKLIAEGNSTKEVAARLGISVKTADCHRTRIMDKLNVHQTASLVRYAVRQGLVQP